MNIKIKLINGQLPTMAHEGDAAFDCYAANSGHLHDGGTVKIPLGFALELPPFTEAQIRGRSGLSSQGVFVALGTVDSGYRGEVAAVVTCSRAGGFSWKIGDRVCQMAIRRYQPVELVEVEEVAASERGNNGFGSTGR